MRQEALANAKLQVSKSHVAVVSTISKNMAGYPFGSVTPYMLDSDGKVYMYISDIAQHARNLREDNKLSLTIYNQTESGDQNESARITLIGDASIVEGEKHTEILNRYVQLYPEAESYAQAHDFNIWQVDIKRVRYIAGFGKIFWLEQEEWITEDAPWTTKEAQGMISHMNDDHRDAMTLILKQHANVTDNNVIMSDILSTGCYLYSNEHNYFIPFSSTCTEKADARKQLVALTQAARSQAA